MKVQVSIGDSPGGIVCTIFDETHTYQLGQSAPRADRNLRAAVEDAVASLLRRILGQETGATVLPPALDEIQKAERANGFKI